MRFVSVKMLGTAAGFAVLALASAAQAQVTTFSGGLPTGDVFKAAMTTPYSANANSQTVAGNVYSAVYSTNTGGEDFFYQFTVTSGTAGVGSFTASDFTGYTTALFASTSGDIDGAGPFTTGGTAPNNGFVSSGTAYFTFGSAISTGQQSATLLVRTNATSYTTNNAGLNGPAATNALVLAANGPTAAPEPGSLMLVIPGVLGVMGMVRRRKSA